MILNSRSISTDPFPYVHDECPHPGCDDLGQRFDEPWTTDHIGFSYDPRDDMWNKPNGLLLAFRAVWTKEGYTYNTLKTIDGARKYGVPGGLGTFPCEEGEQEHAEKVLSRYVAVFG